ncbi:MAG: porin [Ferrimonas sp.]
MKKTIIAAALPALLMANSVAAVELYNDGANKVSMGGHVSASLVRASGSDLKVEDQSPRMNFTFTRELGHGLTLDARTEFGMNFADGDGDMFTQRLGYMTLTSEEYGQVRVGQQWSVVYDVAGVTDMPILFGDNGYTYANGLNGRAGIARVSDAVAYRKGFDFGCYGQLNVGLQWQGAHDEKTTNLELQEVNGDLALVETKTSLRIEDRVAASISYDYAGYTFGYAHSNGTVGGSKRTYDIVSGSYGKYGKGLYAAATYAKTKNVYENAEQAATALVAYGLDNGINLVAHYEKVGGDVLETVSVSAEKTVATNLVVFAGYQYDLETSHHDAVAVGARVYF